ncbi:hypothetical protein ACFFMP_03365 [Pseudoroseomonas cervicalis]|uniref:hypothetical protein n=1 Tax=Teichococcus cervicalis TaxID=204525 RepID=UPI0035E8BC3C
MPSDHAIVVPLPAARPARPLAGLPRRLAAAVAARLEAEWSQLPLWWPVALGLGLVLYFSRPAEPSAGWLALAPPLLLAALWLGLRGRALAGWWLGLLGCLALGFGWGALQAARQPPPLALPAGAVLVSGEVAAVEQLPGALRVTLRGAVWEGRNRPRGASASGCAPRTRCAPGRARCCGCAPCCARRPPRRRPAPGTSSATPSSPAWAARASRSARRSGWRPPPPRAGRTRRRCGRGWSGMWCRPSPAPPGLSPPRCSPAANPPSRPRRCRPCAIPGWRICSPSRGCMSASSWGWAS